MSNMFDVFRNFAKDNPIEESVDPITHEPTFNGINPTTGASTAPQYEGGYTPMYFNSNRYIDAYDSEYFGSNILAVEMFENQSYVPVNDRRIDPNKIFSPDIQAMKSLASEQYKTLSLFEKKFNESLKDKNKYGLTEDDIAAFQAITSGRSAIASINKEIVNVKKTTAEIRLKQQLNANQNNAAENNAGGGKPQSAEVIGRSIMDHIFDMSTPIPTQPASFNAPTMNPENPTDLDSLLPTLTGPIEYEKYNPKTYVIVGETDDVTPTYETYDSDGKLIPDYPTTNLPNLEDIKNIDRDSKLVEFNNEVRLDAKIRRADGTEVI